MATLSAIVPATDRAPTLDACTAAIARARRPPEELVVVDRPAGAGPAAARNAGARRARGEVLVFVDSDVEVHGDAFARIRDAFAADDGLTALFGSYDSIRAGPGTVTAFRNLLHHHVHQACAGPASTFWAGLGAIRRQEFLDVGGFDAARFAQPSIEDVELGMRLAQAGARIELDPDLQGTHLKAWTLGQMVRTDLWLRGVPWVVELLREARPSRALNLGWRHRVSAGASLALVGSALGRRPAILAAAATALVALNRSFYRLLWRAGGMRLAGAGLGLHVLHHVTASVAVPLGAVAYLRQRASPGERADVTGASGASGSLRRSPPRIPSTPGR